MRSAALLVVVVGCGPPPIDGAVVTRGRHIEVHADPHLPVCARSVAEADDYVEAVADLLGVAAPDITYDLYDAPGAPGGCHAFETATADCTFDGHRIAAGTWPQRHELVHAVAEGWGRPPAMLDEGLAEGLSGGYPRLTPAERATAPIAEITDSVGFFAGSIDDQVSHYTIAADFTDYLIARVGIDRYRDAFTSLLFLSDPITVRRALSAATGHDFDDLVADWRTRVPAGDDRIADLGRAVGCTAPAIAADAAGSFALDDSIDCQSGYSWNGARLDQPTWHTIDVTAGGLHAFQLTGPPGVQAMPYASLTPCDDVGAVVHGRTLPGGPGIVLADLGPGHHALGVAVQTALQPRDGFAAPVSWRVDRLGDHAAACVDAPAWTAPDRGWALYYDVPVAAWPGRVLDAELGPAAVTWLRIDPPASTAARMWGIVWTTHDPHVRATACAGACGDVSACATTTDHTAWLQPPPGAPVEIELRAALDSGAPELLVQQLN